MILGHPAYALVTILSYLGSFFNNKDKKKNVRIPPCVYTARVVYQISYGFRETIAAFMHSCTRVYVDMYSLKSVMCQLGLRRCTPRGYHVDSSNHVYCPLWKAVNLSLVNI
jgi:hypothetical protein